MKGLLLKGITLKWRRIQIQQLCGNHIINFIAYNN